MTDAASPRLYRWGLAALIAILTISIYAQVGRHDFIDLDDPGYVAQNPHVTSGLTADNIAWAFTTGHAANWHPLTWLSHMLDVTLFGVEPGAHHLVSLAWHVANSVLLFFLLLRLTERCGDGLVPLGCAAFTAAVFAVHPAHVESVAWIAERKDVLSTFFWLLTTWAYANYLRSRSALAAAATLLSFAAGLMSKPMLVTLPFVLVLLHVWPLEQERIATLPSALRTGRVPRLIFVMIGMAALSSLITFNVQRAGGAVSTLEVMPFSIRLGNALVSYVAYLGKAVWPTDLAIFYPYRIDPSPAVIAGAVGILLAISAVVWRWGRQYPYLVVGWLWYLGTLVPVIGLVQVGTQAMADRYLYVPLIGLTLGVAWLAATAWVRSRAALGVMALFVVVMLATLTYWQVRHWASSLTIWEHTVNVTEGNYRARNSLGAVLGNLGRHEEAIVHFQEALRLQPDGSEAFHIHHNLGRGLAELGRIDEAIVHYQEALRRKPDYPEAHNNLGLALARKGEFERAIEQYHLALEDRPGFGPAIANLGRTHHDLGVAMLGSGRTTDAIREFTRALEFTPTLASALNNRGFARAAIGDLPAAIADFRAAIAQDPRLASAHYHLGLALAATGEWREAERALVTALEIDPANERAQSRLAQVRARLKGGQ